MPITYRIDAPNLLVACAANGVITFDELQAHQKKLNADPAFIFKATARVLWDFSGTTRFDHSAAKIIQVAESWLVSDKTRRALVAKPKSEVAKFLSLWVLHRATRRDPHVRLFNTIEQAQQWLGQSA
jgi:hypothetical protein